MQPNVNVGSPEAGAYNEVLDQAAQQQFATFVKQQNKVLSLILNGADLDRILFKAADVSESLVEGAFCCVRLASDAYEAGRLVTTRQMPSGYLEALNALGDDETKFPLCAAVALEAPQYIDDLQAAMPKKDAASAFETAGIYNVVSAWAQPLVGEAPAPYGALGCFFREPRLPTRLEQRLLEGMAGLVGFAVEHHRHRAALDAADKRFASLADSIPGVVYQRVVSPEGEIRYTYISGAAEDLFGVKPYDIVNNSGALFDTYGADYRKDFRERLLKASRELTMWDVEATIVDKAGRRKYTHAIARPTRQPDGAVVWDGVILDQTRIKEAELAAAAAEARARSAILESLSEAVALFDADNKFITCNSLFAESNKHLAEMLVPGAELKDILNEDRSARIASGAPADEVNLEADARINLQPGQDYATERRTRSGNWIMLKQHRTDDGQTVFLATDVTELKVREQALARSNKELENFASVASHDLQEPLRKIEAFGDRLRRRSGDELSADGVQCIDRMQNAAGRMRSLINDLLSYSRVTTKARPFESCDIKQIVTDVVGDLQVSIEECDGEVSIDDLPTIEADALQMRQLFQNTIGNAIKYRKQDEPPKVAVACEILEATDKRPPHLMALGRVAKFTVQDNGIGFDMKYAEQIFTIFQRLHGRGEYEGTGIGLATVRKIVERHEGAIIAESEPDVGSLFTIYLPIAQKQAK